MPRKQIVPGKRKQIKRNRLGLRATEARLNRMLDAFENEFAMWSWRKRGPDIYEMIRDESVRPGGLFAHPPAHLFRDRKGIARDPVLTIVPMSGKLGSDQQARVHFVGFRNRVAMAKALEAL